MIPCARDIPLCDAAVVLPTMHATIMGWFRAITIGLVSKPTVNFEVQETVRNCDTYGVIQPFRPQQLLIKPEGERSWKWVMLHCVKDPNVVIQTDDQIIIKGVKYRVMDKTDYTEYGYIQYDLVEGYTAAFRPAQ